MVTDDVKYLIRILGSRGKLESELFNLIKQRKNLLSIRNEIYGKHEVKLADYFKEQFDNNFIKIWEKYKSGLIRSVSIINQTVLEKNPDNELALSISELLKDLAQSSETEKTLKLLNELSSLTLTSNGTVKIRGYLSNVLREGLERELTIVQSTLSELSKIEYTPFSDILVEENIKFGKVLLRVFDFVLESYQQKKTVEGFLDYEDILLYTKEILKNENVQKGLSKNLNIFLLMNTRIRTKYNMKYFFRSWIT
jgi:ATP-dependent exoDNAse (exonuclease V) beta subunit